MKRKPGGKRYKHLPADKTEMVQHVESIRRCSGRCEADARCSTRLRSARKEFADGFPKLRDWFVDFDPLYILSFCVFYFLSTPQGVDKEAVDGNIDFGPVHLELLQAFALMGPRTFNIYHLSRSGLVNSKPHSRA